MEVKEYSLKIKEIFNLNSGVKVFRFEIPENTEINYLAGQFFILSLDNDKERLKRAYSIASSPTQKDYIELCILKVGKFTTKMFDTKVGDMVRFKGPIGRFYFTEEVKEDIVMIAGGTGIVPFMSITRYCTDKGITNKLKLLFSVRTPSDILYKEDLEMLKSKNKNFDYFVTITRPKPEHEWQGSTGRINEEVLKENIENIEGSLYFLCGPPEFIDANMEFLKKLGVKEERLRTDEWG